MVSIIENYRVVSMALVNLWRTYQYTQEYVSFLMGAYTKDEFTAKAKEYAIAYRHIDEKRLPFYVEHLLNTLDQPLTSAELSVLLNVDHVDIENCDAQLLEYNPETASSE